MNIVRFAFHWENLQASAKADLDATELGRIDAFVTHATSTGVYTLLDPHNYNYYFGKQVGVDIDASVLADLWSKLATHYKDNDHVVFGLMNEPNALTDVQWLPVANASVAATVRRRDQPHHRARRFLDRGSCLDNRERSYERCRR